MLKPERRSRGGFWYFRETNKEYKEIALAFLTIGGTFKPIAFSPGGRPRSPKRGS
jgi:hypothetical protein